VSESRVLRYPIDIISVITVLAAVSVQIGAFAMGWPWYTMFLIVVLMRQTHLVEHNHSHLSIFHQSFLNEILGFLCFLCNSTPFEFYKVHHVRNHHAYNQRFDGDEQDWSSIFGFTTAHYPDKPVSRLYYVLSFPVLTICQSLIDVLRAPDSRMFRRFCRSTAMFVTASAILIYLDPLSFLFFFFIPWIIVTFGLGNNNYSHHHGCALSNPYNASNVFTDALYQSLGFYIGYHVEHHIRPDLHWSLLPDYHENIKQYIPAENYRPNQPIAATEEKDHSLSTEKQVNSGVVPEAGLNGAERPVDASSIGRDGAGDTFIKIATKEEVGASRTMVLDVKGTKLTIFNLDGDYRVVKDACIHLAQSGIEDEDVCPLREVCPIHGAKFDRNPGAVTGPPVLADNVECPLHGACFNIKTGEVTAPPALTYADSYNVRVSGSDIEIEV
jgi:fatty acid desaturase/nitrite reductase/ring-hydroxylating ferredoxin subunit